MIIQSFKPKYKIEEITKEIREYLEIRWTGLGFKPGLFEEKRKEYIRFENSHFFLLSPLDFKLLSMF